ncbi:putative allantoinase [Staphylococcus gallinarum]|uniref:Putative allantoinase n=1 Tax=Staphylococcus gallinarum TaxID=1293 RepID=A0A380FDQ7_STAGA|nr:putative allantoinase [Staphylococcus gallinarum]
MYDKGSIEIGKDADFVFIKPDSPYTLTEADLEYRNKMRPISWLEKLEHK